MPDITIKEAAIGGARLAVVNNRNRTNYASTLLISYAPEGHTTNYSTAYDQVFTWGGIPLVTTLCYTPDNPSAILGAGLYYAVDVIRNEEDEDPDPRLEFFNPSAEIETTLVMASNPSDKTFTLNGNRLSASKINNRYYMNVSEGTDPSATTIPNPTYPCIFMGIPMRADSNNALIVRPSDYVMDDIQDLINVMIGGSPLTVGRINNSYYLIVKVIT